MSDFFFLKANLGRRKKVHESRKLKRLVIKEELVELCNIALEKAKEKGEKISIDPIAAAIVLQQMLYWGERVRDFDEFITEENKRAEDEGMDKKELLNGWLYKSAEELEEELMGFRSARTISRILNFLVSQGWLDSRNNPNFKWDKTYQYRMNVLQLQIDLQELGYTLEGYKPLNIAFLKMSNRRGNGEISKGTKCPINEDKMSDRREQNVGAIPEITTKITTEKEEEEGDELKNKKTTNEFKNTCGEDSNDFSMEIISFQNLTGIELKGNAHRNIYFKWRKEWGFSYELIIKAVELMCQLARTPNLNYIEQILSEWKRQNISTIKEVEKLISEHRKQSKVTRPKRILPKESVFSDYEIYIPSESLKNLTTKT